MEQVNKFIINGIFHSKDYPDSWIVQIHDRYFTVPVSTIKSNELKAVNIKTDELRPVGRSVEKLLLSHSDMTVHQYPAANYNFNVKSSNLDLDNSKNHESDNNFIDK